MHKLMFKVLFSVMTGLFAQHAAAQVVFTTDVPTGNAELVVNGGQWLAEEFTTSQTFNITSLAAYINDAGDTNQIGNTFTLSVYDNSSTGTPWLASQEFSKDITFAGDGWNGANSITNLQLSAGTYWLAIEVGINDNFQGNLQTSTSSSLAFANYDGISTAGYQLSSGYNFGIQVNGDAVPAAVPLPSSLWLLVSGLAMLSRTVKRHTA
jgi:hypothetical protein